MRQSSETSPRWSLSSPRIAWGPPACISWPLCRCTLQALWSEFYKTLSSFGWSERPRHRSAGFTDHLVGAHHRCRQSACSCWFWIASTCAQRSARRRRHLQVKNVWTTWLSLSDSLLFAAPLIWRHLDPVLNYVRRASCRSCCRRHCPRLVLDLLHSGYHCWGLGIMLHFWLSSPSLLFWLFHPFSLECTRSIFCLFIHRKPLISLRVYLLLGCLTSRSCSCRRFSDAFQIRCRVFSRFLSCVRYALKSPLDEFHQVGP